MNVLSAAAARGADARGAPARNVVLVGFMAAGKSTVGRRLAEQLGWRFVDVDAEIVRRAGATVPDIFRLHGETAFRALEARLTEELAGLDRSVIAPGGGWIAQPGALERLPPGSCIVWLRVSAEEAVRRVGASGVERPLLAGAADPVARAREILAEREPLYGRADLAIDVDGRTPDEIVRELRQRVRLAG